MLARGHGWSLRHGLRPRAPQRRLGRRSAGWSRPGRSASGSRSACRSSACSASILVVLLVGVPIRWLRHGRPGPVLGWRLLVVDVLGSADHGRGRGVDRACRTSASPDTSDSAAEIRFFSPPLRGLLIGPAESRIWGAPHALARSSLGWPAEMSLLPGFVLYALALAGLVFSVWKLWHRLVLLAALALTVDPHPGHELLRRPLDLPAAVRPSAGGDRPRSPRPPDALGDAAAGDPRRRRRRRVRPPGRALVRPAHSGLARMVVAAGHARAADAGDRRGLERHRATRSCPTQPAAMRTVTGPMLVLPTGQVADAIVMLWSTSRYQQIGERFRRFRRRPAGRAAPQRGHVPGRREHPVSALAQRHHGAAAPQTGRRHAVGTGRRHPGRHLGHPPRGRSTTPSSSV